MADWAFGAAEAIRAGERKLCTLRSHKGSLWTPCHRVEPRSYLLAKLYPRQSILWTSTVPTAMRGRACDSKEQALRSRGGWLRGVGWAAINLLSYICKRWPSTQSRWANYWGDLDSTQTVPELGTIKPTIRERKRERAATVSVIYKAKAGFSG